MYEQLKTTKTWAWIKAIPNSKPEKAIMKANGNRAKKKKKNPEFIMLYVKPLRIFKSMWPDNRTQI